MQIKKAINILKYFIDTEQPNDITEAVKTLLDNYELKKIRIAELEIANNNLYKYIEREENNHAKSCKKCN